MEWAFGFEIAALICVCIGSNLYAVYEGFRHPLVMRLLGSILFILSGSFLSLGLRSAQGVPRPLRKLEVCNFQSGDMPAYFVVATGFSRSTHRFVVLQRCWAKNEEAPLFYDLEDIEFPTDALTERAVCLIREDNKLKFVHQRVAFELWQNEAQKNRIGGR